jgi:hypothetical protein
MILTENDLIAKGSERACYLDPTNNSNVIKIIYSEGSHNQQNELEYIYMNYLKKNNKNLSSITQCYGYVETNLGQGLVFDRVLDFDLTPAKSFRYYISKKIISISLQGKLLRDLQEYLEQNGILFVDTSLTNIFCQRISDEEYKLIIVDGLGAKRMGIKFWLYRHFPLYSKYKMKRQWSKLIKMYEKDVKRVELGKRPITRV